MAALAEVGPLGAYLEADPRFLRKNFKEDYRGSKPTDHWASL